MPDASLLTDEVRALIGRAGPVVDVEVTRRHVSRAMDLYLGHHDREFAPGDAVPGYVLVAMSTDGEGVGLPTLLPNDLLISNEMQFERPLRLGERFTMQSKIADISERFGGRFGYSITLRSETELRDAAGRVVARTVQTMMQYDAADERGGGEQ